MGANDIFLLMAVPVPGADPVRLARQAAVPRRRHRRRTLARAILRQISPAGGARCPETRILSSSRCGTCMWSRSTDFITERMSVVGCRSRPWYSAAGRQARASRR